MHCLGGASGTKRIILTLFTISLANNQTSAGQLTRQAHQTLTMVAGSWQLTLKGIALLVRQIAVLLELAADGPGPGGPGPADTTPGAGPGQSPGSPGPADTSPVPDGPGPAPDDRAAACPGHDHAAEDPGPDRAPEGPEDPDHVIMVTVTQRIHSMGLRSKGKFHRSKRCDGLRPATSGVLEVTISEAMSRGLTACSKCWS